MGIVRHRRQQEERMDRLDRIGISRRRLVQGGAALGLAAPLASRGILRAAAQPEGNKIVWVSPRATLEVLDDYGYWVAQEMGYFGDIETVIEPGILEATSGARSVAEGQSDMS